MSNISNVQVSGAQSLLSQGPVGADAEDPMHDHRDSDEHQNDQRRREQHHDMLGNGRRFRVPGPNVAVFTRPLHRGAPPQLQGRA
jgi:hypothetical protein